MLELDKRFRKLSEIIGDEGKLAFFTCFFVGLVCHMFVFVGHYPAYSGLNLFVNEGNVQLLEGRWLAALLMRINGKVTLPFLTGAFSLIFWSLANAVVIRLFEIKSKISIILISCIFVSFPVIAEMNYFLYMAECYAVSAFLGCLGVLFWQKGSSAANNVAGVLCFTLCIASYQAELSLAMVLIFILVALKAIEGYQLKKIVTDALRAAIMLVVSLGLWYAVFKLYLLVFEIDSYRSIAVDSSSILEGIRKSYSGTDWFWRIGTFFALPSGRLVTLFTIVDTFLLGSIVFLYFQKTNVRERATRAFFVVVLVSLFPIVANYAFVVSPDEVMTYRQFLAHVFVFIMPLILCDKYCEELSSWKSKVVQNVISLQKRVTVVMAVVTTVFFCVICNTGYMNSYLQYEREYSLAVRLTDRIELTPGYYPGMGVVLIQTDEYNTYGGNVVNLVGEYIPGMEQRGYGIMHNPTGMQNFMNQFIHTRIAFISGSVSEEILDVLDVFPASNCTVVENGVLYFLLS